MVQIVNFHTNDPLHRENCIVFRNNFENIEFGFPYFDALPVKLTVPQVMDVIHFIKDAIKYLDEGETDHLKLYSVGDVENCIIVRKCFGNTHFLIDFAFSDIDPIMVDINEVAVLGVKLEKMLDIKLLNSPKEDDR